MSLSGKLEIFPLEEVLRLLARSHQSGCLRVEGQGAGKIYLEGGSLTYAAVDPDDALRSHLIASGVVTEAGLSGIDLSNGSLVEALDASVSTSALGDIIREQCVESVYRIRRPQAGPFSFSVDTKPRYATGQSYDIEMVISEADRRAAEWADIEEVVPDLSTAWHMVPSIEEESVKLSDIAWRFLAALEGSSSVRDLSSRLGMTDFQAARRMAELSRARLVEPAATPEPAYAMTEYTTPMVVEEPPGVDEVAVTGEAVDAGSAPTETEPRAESSVDRSWWETETPADEAGPEADPGADSQADGSFLESVFGELEAEEEASEETGEESNDDNDDSDGEGGFGLLRRRGLGAAFRELADS